MHYLGRITDWSGANGFGFATPNGGGDRAFVHAKGRLNASAVAFARARVKREPMPGSALPRVVIAFVAFAVLLVAGRLLEKLPLVVQKSNSPNAKALLEIAPTMSSR